MKFSPQTASTTMRICIVMLALLFIFIGSESFAQQGNNAPIASNIDKPISFTKGCSPGFINGKPDEWGIDAGSDANGDNPVKAGPDHKIWEENDKNGRLVLCGVINTVDASLSHYQLVWIPKG